MNHEQSNSSTTTEQCQPPQHYSGIQALVNNTPYILMAILGCTLLADALPQSWASFAAVGFLVYAAAGAIWIMFFVCPYCRFYNTSACPCGYGIIAAKLRPRQDYDRFAEKFKKHIPAIVPLWFIPPALAVYSLIHTFAWPLVILLAMFLIDAFIILPLLSTKHGCAQCPQKETCPWMQNKKSRSKNTPIQSPATT